MFMKRHESPYIGRYSRASSVEAVPWLYVYSGRCALWPCRQELTGYRRRGRQRSWRRAGKRARSAPTASGDCITAG